MKQISVIGCGRWGTFLGWYVAKYCDVQTVLLYGMESSHTYQELKSTRRNEYLSLSDNMLLTSDIAEALKNEFIIISISCQNLRQLAKQINEYNVENKTFLLAMKGLEEPSAEILADVFLSEIKQKIHVATLGGPGHVEDYVRRVPSAAVIDSYEPETIDYVIKFMQSDLIRFYYGTDIVGNQGPERRRDSEKPRRDKEDKIARRRMDAHHPRRRARDIFQQPRRDGLSARRRKLRILRRGIPL